MFLKWWMFSFVGGRLLLQLVRPQWGLGISKLQFVIKKYKKSVPAVNFLNFGHQNPGSAIRKMLYPDPDTH
jgi:hypothetical protein